jgi:anaerobilin synthase
MDTAFFNRFFSAAPPEVDRESIWRAWQALPPAYVIEKRRPPVPVWARRGLAESGPEAWAALSATVAQTDAAKPYCIYIHLPFCASKCTFCDCYSFRLSQHVEREVDAYLARLEQEIALWSRLPGLAQRPVSTVHLGGGTPTFLGARALARLTGSLRAHFAVGAQTEWALESTSSELDAAMFDALREGGFTRLHVGVQSLEAAARHAIGRREPAAGVLDKLAQALALGWVVSVDLIYGLPSQTLVGLLGDLQTLAAAKVDGLSLYELQVSPRNRVFAERHGRTGAEARWGNYLLLQAASQKLAALGYRKTLFTHFAGARDHDVYFRFPERGEDCLALGTIADGVFGDYHYRHPEYALYQRSVSATFPGLQGGLRRTPQENQLRPLEIALLSARPAPEVFVAQLGREQAQALLEAWQAGALLEPRLAGAWALTANGSWFAGEMLAHLATGA